MKRGFTLIEVIVVIGVIALVAGIVLPRLSDSRDAARAAQVHGNLQNIQEAIDMFNASEGHYPVFGVDIGRGEEGNGFSREFERYYSKGRMPETPAGGRGVSEEKGLRARVFNAFDKGELAGGWLYIEEEGRLYARLEDDAYGQGNIWVAEDGEDGGDTSFFYAGQTLGYRGEWFSREKFDEYTVETRVKVDGVGRIEVYLEGAEGYQLWIHPAMAKVVLRDEDEREVATGSLEDLGITKNTWFDSEEGLPLRIMVSNTPEGKKNMGVEIDGKTVEFNGEERVTYESSSDGSQPVGIINIKKNRPVGLGEIILTPN